MNHIVKQNDTLNQIAKDNNTTVKLLMDLNPGLTEKLRLGQSIKLPILLFKKPNKEKAETEVLNKNQEPATIQSKPSTNKTKEPKDLVYLPKNKETGEQPPNPKTMPLFEDFVRDLEMIENQNGLPEGLLSALAYLESRGNPAIKSTESAGAKGMFQATPIFLEHAKLTNPYDLERIPRAAAVYLKHAKDTIAKSKNIENFAGFGWDREWELAMMAYHSGTQGVLNWLKAGAPLDGKHRSVGERTLNYAERTADLMLNGANPQLIEPGWRKYTNT